MIYAGLLGFLSCEVAQAICSRDSVTPVTLTSSTGSSGAFKRLPGAQITHLFNGGVKAYRVIRDKS